MWRKGNQRLVKWRHAAVEKLGGGDFREGGKGKRTHPLSRGCYQTTTEKCGRVIAESR